MYGIIITSISVIGFIVSIISIHKSERNYLKYKTLYSGTFKFEENFMENIDKMVLPVGYSKDDVKIIVHNQIKNIRLGYNNNMKEYIKYMIIDMFLIILNGTMLVFNVIHYKLVGSIITSIIKILLNIIGR